MNVIQTKRKRTTNKTANRDYLDFIRINPIGKERQTNDSSHGNEYSITTLATRGNSVGKQSSTYLSITSGRGYAHGEVGIAYIDIESPAVKLIQLSDDPWYSGLLMKIHIIDPCEILAPDTIFDANPETSDGKLMKFIREEFPKLIIRKLPRRHFNEAQGMELIKKYGSDKYNYVREEMAAKYYALAAASALLKYLQFVHNIFFKENSLKLDFETKFAHMQIGIDTSYQLELLPQNNPNTVKSKFPSLYSVLDHCVTSFGKRTLRARILEPMCDIPSITAIHDCIAELNQQESAEFGPMLRNVLRNFNNIERLHKLTLVVPQDDNIKAAEVLINQTLHLKKCLQLVPLLRTQLSSLMCQKFQEIQVNLMDERYTSILNHIDNFINRNQMEFHSDSSSKLYQHINCVQEGVNDLIDVLRKSYHDLIGQIDALVGEMVTKHGQAFKTNYTMKRGFHISLMIPNRTVTFDFPAEIEVLETKRNTCYLTTSEVNKLNIRIQSVIEEIIMQSNVVIASMLNDVVKDIDCIYDLSAFTATLDIILSLAMVSANDGYVCPIFGDEMRVVDAIHPLLEQNIHRTVPTPNNIIATPEYNFFMITGPNMSGKTVYIKTIAMLQIMAQLGCYVPATNAQFRITDRMFSRMGFNDSIEKNLSTFMLEMNNMEHILKNVTPNSMVIIDELCRSTNPKEGAQLAWNLCEHLAAIHGIFNDGRYFINDENDVCPITQASNSDMLSTRNALITPTTTTATHNSSWKNTKLNVITAPFIFLTTHFHSLTKLNESCLNVVNLSFSADEITNNENERSLIYKHRIQEGVTTTVSYGLAVAKTVRFPSDIMNEAFELSHQFTTGLSAQNANHPKRKLSNVGRQILQLNRSMQAGDISDMATVISSMINFPIAGGQNRERRRRRRLRFDKQNATNSLAGVNTSAGSQATTTNSEYDEHLKIDRILYNFFGDMMSIARTTQIEFENYSNGDENEKCSAQNEAIENFLAGFIHEQSDEFIEALLNVDLLAEISTPSVERIPNDENRQVATVSGGGGDNAGNNDQIVRNNNLPSVENAMVVNDNDDGDGNFSEKSSIISIQRFPPIILNPEQIVQQTSPQDRLHINPNGVRSGTKHNSSNGSYVSSSSRSVSPAPAASAKSSNKSVSRQAAPYMGRIPHSFGHTSSQSSVQSIDHIPTSFNTSPNHRNNFDGISFGGPTQNFELPNTNTNIDMGGHTSTAASRNTSSGFENFSQGFQSLKNDFQQSKSWNFDDCHQEFSNHFFSGEQQNDNNVGNINGFELIDNHDDDDFDEFLTNSFGSGAFSSPRKRPNLQNIRRNATSSQLSANSANSESSISPQSKASSNSNHSVRSNDSVQSSSTMSNGQSKPNRKVPMIHPSKLKTKIFGDASKMFGTPAAANTNRTTVKVPQYQQQQQQQQQGRGLLPANAGMGTDSQMVARATDTNRNVALQRLQRIELARAGAIAAETSRTAIPQANVIANQPISNTSNGETEANESIVLPPPPGFN